MREAERLKRIRDKRMVGLQADTDDVIEGSEENDVIIDQDPEIASSTFSHEILIKDDSADLTFPVLRKRKSDAGSKSLIPNKKVNSNENEIVCIDD